MSNSNDSKNRALHLLAKRKNPNFEFANQVQWIKALPADKDGVREHKCLICDLPMFYRAHNGWYEPSPDVAIKEHSVKHLKEHNLLVFI